MSRTQTQNRPEFLEYKEIPNYDELIAVPLENDEKSLQEVNRILSQTKIGRSDPYGHLIYVFTGHNVKGQNATKHWKYILRHRTELEQKIGRAVGLRVSSIDYFDTIGDEDEYLKKAQTGNGVEKADNEDWLAKVYSYKYMQERLQEECQRAKRYNYALSLVLGDVDDLSRINEKYGYKIGDMVLTRIIKILKRSIRAVDILSRFRGDQMAIVLPHANKREAQELCERVRKNVEQRSKMFKEISEGFSITLAVSQFSSKESSNDLVARARALLEGGKAKKRNMVYVE